MSLTPGAVLVAWALGLALRGPLCRKLCNKGLARPNFNGQRIPTACGLLIVVIAGGLAVVTWSVSQAPGLKGWLPVATPHELTAELACLASMLTFGALGFLDDGWGDRSVGGLRGHFGRLLKQRTLTTGALKAILGATAAVLIGWVVSPTWYGRLLAALEIALTANGFNLLDTRPARVTVLYLLGWAALVAVATGHVTPLTPALMAGAALAYLPMDRGRCAMLGDTGSNALGAALGAFAAVTLTVPYQAAIVAALLWLHWLSERGSLNAAIERHPWLRRIDERVRGG